MMQFSFDRRQMLQLLGTGAATGALSSWSRAVAAAPVSMEQIKKSGVLHIGCEAAYVPFTYRDSSGKIVGFDVDIVGRYFAPIGVKPDFIDTQWSGVIPALYAGRFDMVPTMSYTKERSSGFSSASPMRTPRKPSSSELRTRTRSRRLPTCRGASSASSSGRQAKH
jgi:polar amino acid transport system substrate-binding protein